MKLSREASMRPSDITDGISRLEALLRPMDARLASMRPSDITDGISAPWPAAPWRIAVRTLQ